MATILSAQNGKWSTGATWVGGQVPGDHDDVHILHTVEIADEVDHYGTITVRSGGVLQVFGDLFLIGAPCVMTVQSGGTVTMEVNITMSSGTLILDVGSVVNVTQPVGFSMMDAAQMIVNGVINFNATSQMVPSFEGFQVTGGSTLDFRSGQARMRTGYTSVKVDASSLLVLRRRSGQLYCHNCIPPRDVIDVSQAYGYGGPQRVS